MAPRSDYFIWLIALLSIGSVPNAYEDPPICAVVEIDVTGQQWINGRASGIGAFDRGSCGPNTMLLVVPDYSAPLGEVVRTLLACDELKIETTVLIPSVRREVEVLYGYDLILNCSKYTLRDIEPVPVPREYGDTLTVTVSTDHSGDVLVTAQCSESTLFGVVDDTAETSEAFRDRRRVRFVVDSMRLERTIEEDDLYIPPPPKLKSELETGVVDDSDTCPYPANGERSNNILKLTVTPLAAAMVAPTGDAQR